MYLFLILSLTYWLLQQVYYKTKYVPILILTGKNLKMVCYLIKYWNKKREFTFYSLGTMNINNNYLRLSIYFITCFIYNNLEIIKQQYLGTLLVFTPSIQNVVLNLKDKFNLK